MGSYALSQNTSKTSNSNLPITLEGDNPLSLTAAGSDGAQVGGSNNINGALNASTNFSVARGGSISQNTNTNTTTLDGGAIAKAFDFGSNLVGIVADLTKNANAAVQTQTGKALEGVLASKEQATAAGDWTQNKTLLYVGAAVVVAYFFLVRK